jgi:hypothetical protein
MLAQIHPHYVAPIMCQPVVRMVNRTVQWIMQHSLFEECGRLTPLEMAEITRGLDHFYSPETQSLPEHFANHLTAHNTAVANDTPFNERDKVAKLRSSLLPCGLYHLAIDAWAREFPTIGLQTFENLRMTIQIADNNRDCLATASAFGYGVAAAVRPAPTPVPTPEYAPILEQFAALAARIDKKTDSKSQSSQPKKDTSPYCHTHGLCAHSSKECQTSGPNHNVIATAKTQWEELLQDVVRDGLYGAGWNFRKTMLANLNGMMILKLTSLNKLLPKTSFLLSSPPIQLMPTPVSPETLFLFLMPPSS